MVSGQLISNVIHVC